MSSLVAGAVTDAAALSLAHETSSDSGPTTALHELGSFGDCEIGIWEMTPGAATDTEVDEVFVVLSGRARVDFIDPPLPSIEVGPGSIVRLNEGMQTLWTVTETLRKVYLA